MNTKFTVGEIAKLSGLSKQTLIYYDKENVFKPKLVDSNNNYRYYTADQIEVLDSILILKEIGLSLKEIKDFMNHRNSDNAVALLKNQQKEIKQKIKQLSLIENRLDYKLRTLQEFDRDSERVQITTLEKTEYLAIEPVTTPNGLLDVDLAIKRLLTKANNHNYPYYYQIGDMVSKENLLLGNYISFEYAFLPLQVAPEKGTYHKKVKGTYAKCYHQGPYKNITDTYQFLIEYIKKEGYQIASPSYEYCILDSLTTKKSEEYVTEIQIKIEKT
ncbi:MerR family transcriptional regulator [Lachnoclostridium phytofermentans]|uniref:Transcriptional regulator, MerR family n=1 Tax=Lachnoclostridium phytofermentans (strain ATCC 700394 / DSM 18823 / ISDg) TaxID=357809 RepID=A9KQS0_LACP7|nr:MerR family transcriptional regulator [Lachnoclostridium phytofermentans]ABX41983.1 transcriptional regulator, MerR family [Lachnoclostridium phytofermentans ISDg]